MTETILLTGVTGYVGRKLLPLLEEKKLHVRCLVRSLHKDKQSYVKGDVLDKASLIPALNGVDTAYYLIHSMGDEGDFVELERKGAQNFAEAANDAGVKRIIYLGGLGQDTKSLSAHLSSRHEVGEILRRYAPNAIVIEFRASIVIGAGSLSFEMVRALCERLPFMITPKWVWAKSQPIAISDLLQYLLEALDVPLETSAIIEIGGTDCVSYADIMREYSNQRKLRRYMIPVPVITPYLSSLWLGLVTPLYSKVGKKLIESACHETIINDPKPAQIFSVKPMGISEAIALALSSEDLEFQDPRAIFKEFPADGTYQIGGRILDIKHVDIPVSRQMAFDTVQRIGGTTGWYYGNYLWKLRGWIDTLFGGVGLRRGRGHHTQLQKGDVLDFWRVENIEPGRRLRLRAEMKVPGNAWLEFIATGDETHARVYQIAIFQPFGVLGVLYWYVLHPLHNLVFNSMIKGIGYAASEKNKPNNTESYTYESELPVSNTVAFAWHEQPGIFERLIPPWQKISVIERNGTIKDGDELTFQIKAGFITILWKALHRSYIKDRQFCDIQVRGPFTYWSHIHKFTPIDGSRSLLTEELTYKLPGGFMGKWLFGRFARHQLDRLFRFRHQRTKNDLSIYQTGVPSMKILIAGSSGLIGKQLTSFLTAAGHQVVPLVRYPDVDGIYWQPKKGELDYRKLEGFDAIINLAGENIASGRWTEKKKQKIRDSRVLSTRTLAEALIKMENPPKVWINGSATGYYGDGNDRIFDESSPPGKGFLAMVCDEWEAATKPAIDAGIRVVNLRTGMVLTPTGGALERMLTPFQLGVGGVLGTGRQYMSWISIDDEIRIIDYCLTHDIRGPVNAVSPQPVTNRAFTKTLGRVLRRPTLIPMPKFLVKWIFGEMGEELLLTSTRVVPRKLEENGYSFIHSNLEETLKTLLGKK